MSISRRTFLSAAAAATTVSASSTTLSRPLATQTIGEHRFDPWLEVDTASLSHNIAQVRRLSGGRPILAVVKNNAYGLGLAPTALALEKDPGIAGFAVVKADAAVSLREVGVRKPVLLMGLATGQTARELTARDIQLSLYNDRGLEAAEAAARSLGRPVEVQLYLDTGMGRMGKPFRGAAGWIESACTNPSLRVLGTYMAFTEEPDFDRQQIDRFEQLAGGLRAAGVDFGLQHAASSNGVFHLPGSHLDMVRPGIALYGAYPSRPDEERVKAELKPAFRLQARVVRVVRLEVGDSVSYGRKYTAGKATWVATIPAGHSDGYPRKAVEGARVLIGDRLYPVIGAVSASHAIVEVGDEASVSVGDTATLVGAGNEAIHPNTVALDTGVSVYDLLMHLSPVLPRVFS